VITTINNVLLILESHYVPSTGRGCSSFCGCLQDGCIKHCCPSICLSVCPSDMATWLTCRF